MGIFNFFKRDEASVKEEAVEAPIETEDNSSPGDILLQALLKGETINKNKAMSIPAVSSAVDRISNLVAMLPVRLYKETINEAGKKVVTEVLDDIEFLVAGVISIEFSVNSCLIELVTDSSVLLKLKELLFLTEL